MDTGTFGDHFLGRHWPSTAGIILVQLQQNSGPAHLLGRMRPRPGDRGQCLPINRTQTDRA